jgi:hypothetical protein
MIIYLLIEDSMLPLPEKGIIYLEWHGRCKLIDKTSNVIVTEGSLDKIDVELDILHTWLKKRNLNSYWTCKDSNKVDWTFTEF